jgi:hypothetical protein
VFADGLRHLEHIQSGFSKHWLQLFIGYNLPPLSLGLAAYAF